MITIMLLVWSALYLVALNATRSHAENLFALDPPHHAVPADRPSVQEFARGPIGSLAWMPIPKQLPALQTHQKRGGFSTGEDSRSNRFAVNQLALSLSAGTWNSHCVYQR
jgi:hypothetical protein